MTMDSLKKYFGRGTKAHVMEEAKFVRLHSDDDDDAIEPLTGTRSATLGQRKNSNWRSLACRVGVGILILLLLLDIASHALQKHRDRKRYQWTSCGETAAEARAAGCHYEPMHRSWIPHACYFSEPSEDYDPYNDRDWFADENMTIPANLDLLRSGDLEVAFTHYFHDEHCLYGWRKLAIAVERKMDMIDSKSYDLQHTSHCSKMIADMLVKSYDPKWDWYFDGVYTMSPLMFQTCIPLKWK
ncbi:MAG: hypothetical protein Q9227_002955 [Pyrenula ochraceoflavens]